MRVNPSVPRASRLLLALWAAICIVLFITFPGKASYVQSASLAKWELLPQKLGRLDLARDLIDLAQAFAGLLIFSAAGVSLGAFVVGKAGLAALSGSPRDVSKAALLATEFLIGHGLFSLVFLILGGLYRLTPTYVILILFAGSLPGAATLAQDIRETFYETRSANKGSATGKVWKALILLSICLLFLTLLYSTAQISYDSSAVYFSNAKLTAMNQEVRFFTQDSFVASLFHSAIQQSALIQLFGDQSARMLAWMYGLTVIVIGEALAERIGVSRPARAILFALIVTTTAFLDLLGDGKVDLMSSAAAIGAIYWLVVEARSEVPIRSLLVLSGFLMGLAIIGRPFNAVLLGGFTVLHYIQRMFIRDAFRLINYSQFFASIAWLGIGVAGLGIYHLFANWMILGDPLAFVSNISKVNPSSGPWNYRPEQILTVRLLYPLVVTYYNSPQTLGNISPLALAFVPVVFLPDIRKKVRISRELCSLCAGSLITLYVWIFSFFTVYEIRYVLFLWVILYMPLAEMTSSVISEKAVPARSIFRTLIVSLLVFFILRTVYIALSTYSPVDDQGNPNCFCESINPINSAAATGDRVLTLSAFRYYLRKDLFACSTTHEEYDQLRESAKLGAEPFWLEVYRQGYRFISFESEYVTRHLQLGIIPRPENAPGWISLQPLYSAPEGTHIAYRLDYVDPPTNGQAICQHNDSGVWEVRYDRQLPGTLSPISPFSP